MEASKIKRHKLMFEKRGRAELAGNIAKVEKNLFFNN
jgi:hypothetical protein